MRYVRARETYDPRALKDNYDLAQLYSTAMASSELERDFEPSNPRSKDKVFGRETKVEVTVKSVSFLNKTTATVRLQTTTKRQNTAKTEDWVSVIRFRYTTSPLKRTNTGAELSTAVRFNLSNTMQLQHTVRFVFIRFSAY